MHPADRISQGLVAVHGSRKLIDVLALAGGTTVTAGNEVEISRGGTEEDSESIHYSMDPGTMETTFVRPGEAAGIARGELANLDGNGNARWIIPATQTGFSGGVPPPGLRAPR